MKVSTYYGTHRHRNVLVLGANCPHLSPQTPGKSWSGGRLGISWALSGGSRNQLGASQKICESYRSFFCILGGLVATQGGWGHVAGGAFQVPYEVGH